MDNKAKSTIVRLSIIVSHIQSRRDAMTNHPTTRIAAGSPSSVGALWLITLYYVLCLVSLLDIFCAMSVPHIFTVDPPLFSFISVLTTFTRRPRPWISPPVPDNYFPHSSLVRSNHIPRFRRRLVAWSVTSLGLFPRTQSST